MNPIRLLMHSLAGILPANLRKENPGVVRLYRKINIITDIISFKSFRQKSIRLTGKNRWPVVSGSYFIGNPNASVAVCTLTSNALPSLLASNPEVCLAGRLYTPNLGIEKIIGNIITNPYIRYLLICGRESSLFYPGQALESLFTSGVDGDRRIIGAKGHFPVLKNVSVNKINQFCRQVELINCIGETEVTSLSNKIEALSIQNPGPFSVSMDEGKLQEKKNEFFISILPGGHREPLSYDPKGFFIITVDNKLHQIVIRHYLPDHTPKFEMRGQSSETMLLGLIRENLVSQLSHAGYLGAELLKAEMALRNNLSYEQDRLLTMKK